MGGRSGKASVTRGKGWSGAVREKYTDVVNGITVIRFRWKYKKKRKKKEE